MVVSRLESESNLSGSSSSLEITPAGQDLLGLTGDPIDDFGRRRNIMDQSDSLAGDDCGNIKIPGGPRRGIVSRDGSDILHQLDLTAEPTPRVIEPRGSGERNEPTARSRRRATPPREEPEPEEDSETPVHQVDRRV